LSTYFVLDTTRRCCGQPICAHSPHQLEDDAEVIAKQEVVGHVDDVESAVDVELAQRVQHPHFNQRLMVKPAHTHTVTHRRSVNKASLVSAARLQGARVWRVM